MEIQDIKLHLTLSQLLQYYGLKPDKNGRLNCPFHEDKTPSLQVYYKTGTVYCFSSNCPLFVMFPKPFVIYNGEHVSAVL